MKNQLDNIKQTKELIDESVKHISQVGGEFQRMEIMEQRNLKRERNLGIFEKVIFWEIL